MVYTQGQHVVFSYKLSKLSPNHSKYHNLKKVYAFEFREQVQFRRQNGTVTGTKFLSVNQQQQQKRVSYNKNGVKRPSGTKYSKNKKEHKR